GASVIEEAGTITATICSAGRISGRVTNRRATLSRKRRMRKGSSCRAQNKRATEAANPSGTLAKLSCAKLYSALTTKGGRGRKASAATHRCTPGYGPLAAKNS